MKKGVLIVSLVLILFMFSVSFASASWFSDFWGKITGNVVSGTCPIGLMGYWKFDGNFADSSGNGNNGFCSGSGCPTYVTGKVGGAYSFNGFSNYVDIGKDVIGNGAVSICAWIYPVSWGGGKKGRIVNNDRAWVYVNNGNSPGNALSFTSDGVHYSASSLNSIKLNEWSFVCVSRNVKGTPVYYINSVLSPLGINGGGSPAAAITNTIIGGRQTASDRSFNGTIDEVMIYNRELSFQEITNLYNSGNGKDVCGAISSTLPPTTSTPNVPTCTENWNCSSWSACSNNQQIKTCIDANNCGTVANKPSLIQACAISNISTRLNNSILLNVSTQSNITTQSNASVFQNVCTDSDGGKDYYAKGIVSVDSQIVHEDSCWSPNAGDIIAGPYVIEYFCSNGEIKKDDVAYYCPNGCSNGACLTGKDIQDSEIPGLSNAGMADPSVLLNKYSFNCSEKYLLGYAGGDAGGFSRSVSNGNDMWGFLIYGKPSFNSNSVYIEQGGIVGNALVFKGETKKTYQNYMSASLFSSGKIDEIAISFWIKTSSVNGVIFSSDYPLNFLMDNVPNKGQSKMVIKNPRSLEILLQTKNYKTGISLSDNAWHNVIVSFNFSSKSMNLFKDGVLVSSMPVSLMKTSFTDGFGSKVTGEFFISPGILGFGDEVVFNSKAWAWSLKHKSPFKGMLDEVAIFSKSFSSEDAGRVYSKGVSGKALCAFLENILSKNCSKTYSGWNFNGVNYPKNYCADNKTLINLQCGLDGLNWNSSRCDKCLGTANGVCLIIDDSRSCTLLASTLKSGGNCPSYRGTKNHRIVTQYTSFKVPESCKTNGCLLRIDSYHRIFNNTYSWYTSPGKLEKTNVAYFEFKQTGQNWEANILGDSKKVSGKNGDSKGDKIASSFYSSISLYDDAKEKKSDYLSVVDNECGSAEVDVLICE